MTRILIRTTREEVVSVVLAAGVIGGSLIAYAYLAGRDRESRLTLDAYGHAQYATYLLRQLVPQTEAAQAMCRATNEELETTLGLLPVPHVEVMAGR